MIKADLHFHSKYSDGVHTTEELIKMAKERGINCLSLTDHDSLDGVEEMQKLGKEYGITIIPGLELSTILKDESVHILAYFPNLESIPSSFIDFLIESRKKRYERLKKMTELVNNLYGLKIDFNKIAEKHPYNLERPHLADAIGEALNISRKEAFDRFIGNSSPAYIPSTKLDTSQGIKLIHEANGVAVLAHPYEYHKNDPFELLKLDVDGVEAIYFPQDSLAHSKYIDYAKKHSLIITGGSDFHKENDGKHKDLGDGFYGSPYVEELLKKLNI